MKRVASKMKYRVKVLLTIVMLLLFGCFFNYLLQYEVNQTAKSSHFSIRPPLDVTHAPQAHAAIQEHSRQVCDLAIRMDSRVPVGCPGDEMYNTCMRVFNSALKGLRPLAVVRPRDASDIKTSLVKAAQAGLQVTVKNGGHNPAGHALNDKGMVIDMKDMNSVTWGGDSGLDIISGGGATWEQVHKVLQEKPRTIVGGGCPQVGVVGLALGGGVGWLSRSRGLVSDNVLSLKIVFPNGTLAIVDDERNSELMWALRGAGGSNFGVVTEVRLRTFPGQPEYFAGVYCYEKEPDDLRSTLELVQSVMNGDLDLDDRLTMDMFMSRVPQRLTEPDISLSKVKFCWGAMFDGPTSDAMSTSEVLLSKIAELPSEEEACSRVPSPCQSMATTKDAVDRMRNYLRRGGPWLQKHSFKTWSSAFGAAHLDVFWKSVMADDFTDEIVNSTIRHFRDIPELLDDYGSSPVLQIAFEHLGGAMSRNGNKKTAWKHGNSRVMGSIQSYIPHPLSFDKRGTHEHKYLLQYLQNWTRSYYDGLAPHSQGSYGNYADSELHDWADKYYGREVYDRLRSVKKEIQGSEIFSASQRIDSHKDSEAQQSVDSLIEPSGVEEAILDSSSSITNSIDIKHPASNTCPEILLATMVPISRSNVSWTANEDMSSDSVINDSASHRESRVPSIGDEELKKIRVNQTVLVTGGSRGIGWSTTLHLANLGMSVVYTSQTENGCHDSLDKIKNVANHSGLPGSISCISLRLDDFESIRSFVERNGWIVFDAVVLNAGNFQDFRVSEKAGNVSNSLAANHLGHFLLVHELLKYDCIEATSGTIVVASSFAIESATRKQIKDILKVPAIPYPDLDASSSVTTSGRFLSYAAVKAINYMFANELAKRLQQSGSNIYVGVVASPGTAVTDLVSDMMSEPKLLNEILRGHESISTSEAALGIVYIVSGLDSRQKATDEATLSTGCGIFIAGLPALTKEQDLICNIWDSSLKITNLTGDLAGNPQVEAFTSPCVQHQK